jgi:hypothetical protein
MIVKLTKEQVDFLKGNSAHINDGQNKWYYLPFWFKEVDEDKFEITQFDQLPGHVIDVIKDRRS